MSQPQHKSDIVSGCRILTQYPVEEFTFTWHVTNYSKIFNTVRTQFSTSSGITTWELRLKKSRIELWRYFEGEILDVQYVASLFNNKGTFTSKGDHRFGRIFDSCTIMEISQDFCSFKDDILKFKCTLTILGHTITRKIESPDSDVANFKQFSRDMKDLFDKQEHCDVTMSVGQDRIQVHRSVLCARSPVFNKMFQYSMLESDSNEIEINDIDFEVLLDFLAFLYSGELKELSWDRALDLYYAADKYELKSLRKTCSEFLEFNLDIDEVCNVLKLADMHKDEKLKDSAMWYARTHSSSLKTTEDWQELLKTHPKLAVEILK